MTKTPAMPERFTKKPVTIEAVQFTEALRDAVILDAVPLPEGIKFGRANYNLKDRKVWSADFYIETLEGRMKVDIGDWIIKGVKGEFYPCKPGIFELTYDRAAQQSAQPAEVSDAKWEGAEEWMPLAWKLCADECGEEACTELVWEGGPIPEPWGDRWLKYEDEAKRLIELVRKHVPSLRPQAVPMTREEKLAAWKAATIELPSPENCYLRGLVDAEAHHGITKRADGGEG